VTAVGFVWFLANLLLAGALLRTIELKWPDSWLGRSLGVVY
jgi:hypothetical protein